MKCNLSIFPRVAHNIFHNKVNQILTATWKSSTSPPLRCEKKVLALLFLMYHDQLRDLTRHVSVHQMYGKYVDILADRR